jgi:hypothetical protein
LLKYCEMEIQKCRCHFLHFHSRIPRYTIPPLPDSHEETTHYILGDQIHLRHWTETCTDSTVRNLLSSRRRVIRGRNPNQTLKLEISFICKFGCKQMFFHNSVHLQHRKEKQKLAKNKLPILCGYSARSHLVQCNFLCQPRPLGSTDWIVWYFYRKLLIPFNTTP